MKKKNIIITLAAILLIILNIAIYIFKEVDYDENEFKLGIKSLFHQELTLEEMENSNLYKAYEQINYKSDIEEINNILKKENKRYAGSFECWDLVYGRILIMPSQVTEQKVLNKLVSFNTPEIVELSDDELDSLFECKTLDEVIYILGDPIIKCEGYNKDGEIDGVIYEWGIKAKYFNPEEKGDPFKFPVPYKQKFRVNVDVITSNLIHKLDIEKY